MPLSKGSSQGPWFYRTPSLIIAIGPPGGRTMVLPACKMNFDDIALSDCAGDPPLDPTVCEQNTGGATEELGTGVKNMDECLGKTKDASPSSPIACSVIPDVVEHVEHLGDKPPFLLLRRTQPLTIPWARLHKNQMEGTYKFVFGRTTKYYTYSLMMLAMTLTR